MELQLAANVHILACCGFALLFGIFRINAKKKAPTYLLFSLFATLSEFLSRVYYVLAILFFNGLPQTFNVGFVGYAATLLFFLLANIGQIDWLVDDRKTVKPIYRIIPAIIPAAELCAALYGLTLDNVTPSIRVSFVVISIIAGFAGYFNIKHVIIPDVVFGIVRSVRGYNLIAFSAGLLSLCEIGFSIYGLNDYIIYVQIVLGALFAAALPILSAEVKKWTR